MESKQEHIMYKLKNTVQVEFDKVLDKWRLSDIGGFVKLPDELFTIIFEPLDIVEIRKQFRDALEPEICYWQDTSDDTTEYWGEELLDKVVDRILEVTLGRKQ